MPLSIVCIDDIDAERKEVERAQDEQQRRELSSCSAFRISKGDSDTEQMSR